MGKGKYEAIREAIKEKIREYTCDLGVRRTLKKEFKNTNLRAKY